MSEKPLTAKQRAVVNYLRDEGWTRQDGLAAEFNSTLRGIGNVLSALLWRDDVPIRSRDGVDGSTESREWTVEDDERSSARMEAAYEDWHDPDPWRGGRDTT